MLDRGTSGVLLAAKTREAAKAIEAVFRAHLAEKKYLALTAGAVSKPGGRIEYPLIQRQMPSGVNRFVAVKRREEKKA